MLALAHLACDLALPTEDVGINPLFAPAREEYWVRKLYEKAVSGFYSVVLSKRGWTVHPGQTLRWLVDAGTQAAPEILPDMRTDVVLNNLADGRRIIVDTKFNVIMTKGWYREQSVRSAYLYQIYAYLRSQEGEAVADRAEGLLLHPSIGGETIDEGIRVQGHIIRFSIVNLTATPEIIRHRLTDVVEKRLCFVAS